MDVLLDAFLEIFRLSNFIAMIAGVIGGIAIGALPGLSATMAISVLIPLTFFMEPLAALGMIAGIYNGAMYGGSIPAVLLRIPGTPAAVATTFDGYPMARNGQAGWALQIACVSSAVGGMASAIALMTIAPPLSYITLAFGPAEVFWVAVFGLTAIVFLVGEQPVKGLISALFGVVISLVGTDVITGVDRYTFGRLELLDGLNVVVMLVGLYAIPPMIGLLLDDPGNEAATKIRIEQGGRHAAAPEASKGGLALRRGDHRPDPDKGAAGDPVEDPAPALQPGCEPAGSPCQNHLIGELDDPVGAGKDDELQPQRLARLHELRQESREEDQGFGVGDGDQKPLREGAAPGDRPGRGRSIVDRGGGKARRSPQPDAEPNEIGRAHPFDHREEQLRGLHDGAQTGKRGADQEAHAGHRAERGEDAAGKPVPHAVIEAEQAVRPRRQRQGDGGQNKDEPQFGAHASLPEKGRPAFSGTCPAGRNASAARTG